jgi:peptide chain release factor subunit 1
LKALVPLARSSHLFLSAYLEATPGDTSMDGLRLRLAARLTELAQDLAGTPWARPFQEERAQVESFVKSLRPGGRCLALLSSQEAGAWTALWLPSGTPDHVRFGRGAYVLPLVDMLDEWEPVGLVEVHKDKARIMVLTAGRMEETQEFQAEVPGRSRAGGGAPTRYRPGGSVAPGAQHAAGGGAGARFERHIEVHIEEHLKDVAQGLNDVQRRVNFRRFFLAGPAEARALFKSHLSHEMEARLMGDLSVDPRATGAAIAAQVSQAAQEAERRQELAMVQEAITRAEKRQGAVAGVAATLGAINDRQVRLLMMSAEMDQPGRYCQTCGLILPPEDIVCPRCDAKTRRVRLWEELPGIALGQDIALEVVHGQAASDLWAYEGIGALLKPPAAH